jgi:hypothetical protein
MDAGLLRVSYMPISKCDVQEGCNNCARRDGRQILRLRMEENQRKSACCAMSIDGNDQSLCTPHLLQLVNLPISINGVLFRRGSDKKRQKGSINQATN